MCSCAVVVVLCSLVVWANGLDNEASQQYDLYSLVVNSELLQCNFSKSLGLDVSLIKIYMYDFANNKYANFYVNQTKNFLKSYDKFEAHRTSIVYIPGFGDNVENSINSDNVRINLANVSNSYLYMIDHHSYTYMESNLLLIQSYERAVAYSYDIGKAVAGFIVDLVDHGGIDYSNTIVAGHSLGGQIIAAVGEVFTKTTNKLLPVIKGIDPAGPCFSKAPKEFQLRSGLARHTETYHCNAAELGTTADYSDANYYVNGGFHQPGCNTPPVPESVLSALASICSHNVCPTMVTENARVTGIWDAYPCSSVQTCSQLIESANKRVTAGFYSNTTNSGLYYFKSYQILLKSASSVFKQIKNIL